MAIPFYGASDPELFAIERKAMDRPGRVREALDVRLPASGLTLDVGAGDGFMARALSTDERSVVALEPAPGMHRQGRDYHPFVAGVAQELPFCDAAFDAAFSTWAYFFTGEGWDPSPGLREMNRVVRGGGPLLIVDNLGGDEFTALGGDGLCADLEQWKSLGFDCASVETEFSFTSHADALRLLRFYFGPAVPDNAPLSYSYRVGVFHRLSTGAQAG